MSKPKYTSQPMIASTSTAPAVTPWVYATKVMSGRFFAIALSVADGLVTFSGLRAGGSTWFASVIGATFIAVFQASMWLALSSGQPVGTRFQQRFFEDTGAIGFIKRLIGVVVIVLGVSIYLWDMVTNYSAFTGGRWLAMDPDAPVTLDVVVKTFGYVLLSIAFSIGDELLHVVSDENALGQTANQVRYQGQRYEAQLLDKYQRHYMKRAKPVADELGADHGARWRPRDLS
jgi:hypothetical protein